MTLIEQYVNDAVKVLTTIETSKTVDHFDVCRQLVNNYRKKWTGSHYSPIVKKDVIAFNNLIDGYVNKL